MPKVNQGNFRQPTHRKENMTKFYDPGPVVAKPECSVCNGSGVVHPRALDGSPNYSRTIACVAPGCMADSASVYKNGENIAKSGLHTKSQTFENFKLVKGTEKAFKFASELAAGAAKFVWLLIYGGVGNGKTHLCNAIAKVSLERGIEVLVMNSADMFSQIKAAMNDNASEAVIKRFKEVSLLIIDDWGVEYGTDWQLSIFDEILDARYWTARATVVTTNKDITELPKRIESRFSDKRISRTAFNAAGDYRKR